MLLHAVTPDLPVSQVDITMECELVKSVPPLSGGANQATQDVGWSEDTNNDHKSILLMAVKLELRVYS